MVPAITKAASPRWCTLATHHTTAGLERHRSETSAENHGRSGVSEASFISHGSTALITPHVPGGRKLIIVTRDSGSAGFLMSPAMSQHALGYVNERV